MTIISVFQKGTRKSLFFSAFLVLNLQASFRPHLFFGVIEPKQKTKERLYKESIEIVQAIMHTTGRFLFLLEDSKTSDVTGVSSKLSVRAQQNILSAVFFFSQFQHFFYLLSISGNLRFKYSQTERTQKFV